MHLYSLPLLKPGAITSAAYGNFSSPHATEFCVARGNIIEVLRPSNSNDGLLESVVTQNTYGSIRSLSTIRLWGGDETDYIVMTSDSGAVTVLSLVDNQTDGCTLNVVSQTFFGKTGCRRVVPGQMLTCEDSDNGGRVLMVAASEKQKLVFKVGKGDDGKFIISSALPVDKPRTITFDTVSIDVGTEHPEFVCLEINYGTVDDGEQKIENVEKMLSYYKMDLTLNNVVLTSSIPTIRSANRLISVPGGSSGPGGVIVLGEGEIQYYAPPGTSKKSSQNEIKVNIPCRSPTFGRKANSAITTTRLNLIVSFASIAQREQKVFFCLVQTEEGDIFRINLICDDSNSQVNEIEMTYFDTIPVCSSMCISRNGLLFAASEFGDHTLYRIVGDGSATDVEGGTATSSNFNNSTKNAQHQSKKLKTNNYFTPSTLNNLETVETIDSTSSILDIHVSDLCKEGTPQIYTLCGRGSRSSLRVLRYGLPVDDFTRGAALPGIPTKIFSLKKLINDEYDSFIVVCFTDSTLVLSVGDDVKEVKDSGFDTNKQTLHIVTLSNNAGHAQVHPEGILMVLPNNEKTEWKAPLGKRVIAVSANSKQIVVGLEGGTIVYFEMGPNHQMLNSGTYEVGSEITCVDLGEIPDGRVQSSFLSIGSTDQCIRLLSLSPDRLLDQLSMQIVPSIPHSICLVELNGRVTSSKSTSSNSSIHLCIGLKTGVLMRTQLDGSGNMSTLRSRFLGVGNVTTFRVLINRKWSVVACSSQTWLVYSNHGKPTVTPISLGNDGICTSASSFSSNACPDGIVATMTKGNSGTLRIFSVEDLGTIFNQQVVALQYTPRKMSIHSTSNNIIIIESDHNALSVNERDTTNIITKDNQQYVTSLSVHDEDDEDGEDGEQERELKLTTAQVGYACPPVVSGGSSSGGSSGSGSSGGSGGSGGTSWASCIRVVRPNTGETLDIVELTKGEAAFSMTTVQFKDRGGEEFIVIGSAISVSLHPTSHYGGKLRVYRYIKNKLMLVHTTDIEGMPLALEAFDEHLLVGVGTTLRMYSMGKKRLLRKCECRSFPTMIRTISTHGDRICVGDMTQSFIFLKYTKDRNELLMFADDSTPRYTTCGTLVDYQTIAGGDKFGNMFVLRLPDQLLDDGTATSSASTNSMEQSLWDANPVHGASNKLIQLNQYYIGDIMTSITKTSVVTGAKEVLLYSTIQGRIGIFLPMLTRSDVEFFQNLELNIRKECSTLSGWSHFAYRSYYIPLREVVDGSLCEMFFDLSLECQTNIANNMEREIDDIKKKIEDQRQRAL